MYPLIIILIVERQKSVIHSFQTTISHSIHFASAPRPNDHPNNTISLIEGIGTQIRTRSGNIEDGFDVDAENNEAVQAATDVKVN